MSLNDGLACPTTVLRRLGLFSTDYATLRPDPFGGAWALIAVAISFLRLRSICRSHLRGAIDASFLSHLIRGGRGATQKAEVLVLARVLALVPVLVLVLVLGLTRPYMGFCHGRPRNEHSSPDRNRRSRSKIQVAVTVTYCWGSVR